MEVGEIIVAGTRHVLDVARDCEAERMLFLSSGAVYGRQPVELTRVPESYIGGPDISNPLSTYGEAKRYAEVLCVARAERQGLPVTIARPFTAIGAYMDLDAGYAATDFLRDAIAGRPLRILSDGTTMRSYCTAADYVRALWGVLFRGVPGRAYNIGSDDAISVRELAQRMAECLPQPAEIHIAREAVPGQLPERYVPDITRLSSELDTATRQPMERGIRRAIAWASHVLAGDAGPRPAAR